MALGDDFTLPSFSFLAGDDGSPLSYEALKRRQAIAQAVASQKRAFPKTFGEGLTYLGESIGDRMQEKRLAAAEAEFTKRNQANTEKYLGAGARGGAAPPVAAPPVAAPPVAAPPAAAPPAGTMMGPSGPYRPAAVRPVDPGAAPPGAAPPGAPYVPQDKPVEGVRDRLARLLNGEQAQATPEVAQSNPTLPGALPPVQAEAFLPPSQEQTPTAQPISVGGLAADDPVREARRGAIGGIESDGSGDDPYAVVGKPTRGNYPLGRYQIMSNNLPEWSAAALGREVTPQEFLGDKKVQDAIFDHRFGGYADKYGEEGAARAWYAGEKGMGNLNATDRLGRLNVQQYGQDYLRRLGRTSDAGDTSGAPVRLASLGPGAGGTMSDAPSPGASSLLPHTPGVNDDENPPTPTDIAPAPDDNAVRTMLAQANTRPQLTSDMFSPTPTRVGSTAPAAPVPAGAPAAARGAEEPSRIAGATGQVYVAPKPVLPPQPQKVPMTQREAGAHALLASDPTNPYTRSIAEQVIQEESEKRKFEQDRNNTVYQAAVQHYQQLDTAHQTSLATQQERQMKLDAEIAAEKTRQAYGTLPEPIITQLKESKKDAESSVAAQEAIRNARIAIDAGTIFGAGAKIKLEYYRGLAALGNQDAARLVAATENYPTNLGGLIGQQIRQYGGAQISNTDRQYGERMSGGDITLNEQTARRLLDIGERAAQAKVGEHADLVKATLEGQPARLQEVYKARGAVAPTPMAEPIPNFRSEAEAEAAGLKPGTKIKINGRGATVH